MATIACYIPQGLILSLPDPIAPIVNGAPLNEVNISSPVTNNVPDAFWNTFTTVKADFPPLVNKQLVRIA